MSSNVPEVTDATFETDVLQSEKPVVVDFWAEWCGPCRMVAPEIDKLAAKYAGTVEVRKLDVDANPQTAMTLRDHEHPDRRVLRAGPATEGRRRLPAAEALEEAFALASLGNGEVPPRRLTHSSAPAEPQPRPSRATAGAGVSRSAWRDRGIESAYCATDALAPERRPARHLHAALQHRADRCAARSTTWPSCPRSAGPEVSRTVAGMLTAAYFAAELILSPVFGVLSDRFGAHRIMQLGPIFGAVAVVITALTTDLCAARRHALAGGRGGRGQHPVDPRATSRSSPRATRACAGEAVARFEAATLAGLGVGAVAAGPPVRRSSVATRSTLNAVVYGVIFADLPLRRPSPVGRRRSRRREPAEHAVSSRRAPRAAARPRPLPRAAAAAGRSGCWPRPGSR